MKRIVLGDIHGRTDWIKIVGKESFDEIIFDGDYFDNESMPISDIIDNFMHILEFKKSNPDKVVLLIGNHDFHYLPSVLETYSGFKAVVKPVVSPILHEAIKNGHIQACHSFDQYLVSHAGFSYTWCLKHGIPVDSPVSKTNDLLKYTPYSAFCFQSGPRMDRTGNDVTQGPIWIRPNSLMMDGIAGFTQIVGHTTQHDIIDYGDVILIDCPGKYLVIEDSIKFVKSV